MYEKNSKGKHLSSDIQTVFWGGVCFFTQATSRASVSEEKKTRRICSPNTCICPPPHCPICSSKHILRQGVSRSTLFTCFYFRSTLTNDELPIHNSPGWRDFKVQLKDCYKSWHGWYNGVVQLVFRKQIGCSREKQVKNWMQWAGTGQRWVNPPRYTSWLIGILLSCNGRGENFSNSFQLNQNISINELILHLLA